MMTMTMTMMVVLKQDCRQPGCWDNEVFLEGQFVAWSAPIHGISVGPSQLWSKSPQPVSCVGSAVDDVEAGHRERQLGAVARQVREVLVERHTWMESQGQRGDFDGICHEIYLYILPWHIWRYTIWRFEGFLSHDKSCTPQIIQSSWTPLT